MKNKYYKILIKESPVGYAYHRACGVAAKKVCKNWEIYLTKSKGKNYLR